MKSTLQKRTEALARNQESLEHWQRILRDFADDPEIVNAAKQKIRNLERDILNLKRKLDSFS